MNSNESNGVAYLTLNEEMAEPLMIEWVSEHIAKLILCALVTGRSAKKL